MRLPFLSVVAISCLCGCASITSLGNTFEGAADYRIIPAVDYRYPASDPRRTPLFDDCGPLSTPQPSPAAQEDRATGARPAAAGAGSPQGAASTAVRCGQGPQALNRVPLADYSLFQAHPPAVGPDDPLYFDAEDNLQISLRMGVVGWFSEGAEQRLVNRMFGTQVRGEIAIIANATDGRVTPGGLTEQGELDGRVVFYSGDVYAEQRLNEFNVPIYGPKAYSGGPLTIDLWVLELDRAESDQMSAILGTLSRLAGETTGGGAAPVLGILNQLGTAFLNSNQDDIIGRIRITLVPPHAGQHVTDPILQVSDIVVSRTSRGFRGSPNMLDHCFYEPETARVLAAASGPDQCGVPINFHRNNLFVLSIRKSRTNTELASDWRLSQLNDRLAAVAADSPRARAGTAFNEAVDQVGDGFVRDHVYHEALDRIERVRAGSIGAPRNQAADFVLKAVQCGLWYSRDGASAALDQVCGARAAQRVIGPDQLARLTQKLATQLCLTDDDLSFRTLLTESISAESLTSARGGLLDRFRPRVPGTAPGSSCQPS